MQYYTLSKLNPRNPNGDVPNGPTGISHVFTGIMCRITWGTNLSGGGFEQAKDVYNTLPILNCLNKARDTNVPWVLDIGAACFSPSWLVDEDHVATIQLPSNACAGSGETGGTDPNFHGIVPVFYDPTFVDDFTTMIQHVEPIVADYPPLKIKVTWFGYQSDEFGVSQTPEDSDAWIGNPSCTGNGTAFDNVFMPCCTGPKTGTCSGQYDLPKALDLFRNQILPAYESTGLGLDMMMLFKGAPDCSPQGCTTGDSTQPFIDLFAKEVPGNTISVNSWGTSKYPCGIKPELSALEGTPDLNLGLQAATPTLPPLDQLISGPTCGSTSDGRNCSQCALDLEMNNFDSTSVEIYQGQLPAL